MTANRVGSNFPVQGQKKININKAIDLIRDILRNDDVKRLEDFLKTFTDQTLKAIRLNEDFKFHAEGILSIKSKTDTGVELALSLYRNGLAFESDRNNPITTNTIICTAQRTDTWKAVELVTLALLYSVKVDPRIILCTLVDADEDLTSLKKIDDFNRLAKIAAGHLDLNSTDVVGTYNVILAKLGDPTSERDTEDRNVLFVAEKVKQGASLARKLVDKGIRFHYDDLETRLRMNHLIRGVRTVSESLIQSIENEPHVNELLESIGFDLSYESEIKKSSSDLMKEAFGLLERSIGVYEIKGETVNSSFSSLFTHKIPLDDELLKNVENTFLKSMDVKSIRIHLVSTTLNVLARYILDSSCSGKFNILAGMIKKASSYGYRFHDEILKEVREGCSVSLPHKPGKARRPIVLRPAVEPQEVNGVLPLELVRKFFPEYVPEAPANNLRGGLGIVKAAS